MRSWKKIRKVILYIVLLSMIKIFIEVHHFSLAIYIILSLGFIIPELLSEYKPELMGYIIARRETQTYSVFAVSLFFAAGFYFRYPFTADFLSDKFIATRSIASIILQGAILGLVSRMILIHLIYQLVRLRDVFFSKALILIVYTVFLILLPLSNPYLIAFFFLGFGLGFVTHFFSRYTERRYATIGRLQQNLRTMIEDMRHGVRWQLNAIEEIAVKYYASQKWDQLQRLLNSNDETVTLFFIRLCMLRKRNLFDAALHQLDEKEKSHPKWFNAHKNFFLLHRALNNNEKTLQGDDRKLNEKILQNLLCAIKLDDTCLLSHASYALKLANGIDLDSTDPRIIAENETKKKEALFHITRAMDIYENRESEKRLFSIMTGITVPCTYSFLLDTYGIVLMKNGKMKFAKALLIQCLFQDPSFSPAYVHLAEWYKEYYKTSNHEHGEWKKAAKLNLYIAIYNEEYDSKNGNVSYITKKAKAILQTL